MQLYQVNLDESGTHRGSRAVAVGGFVSTATRWERFAQEWQDALRAWGLRYFHMTDFESRHGPYASWGETQRKERLNTLLDIIHRYAMSSIGCIIQLEAFERLMSDKAKQWCGDAYGLASIACYRKIAETASDPGIDGLLDIVMDRGVPGFGALHDIFGAGREDAEWLNQNRIASLAVRDKELWCPLQAADILAYELYKQAARQFGGDKRVTRYPLKQLARSPKTLPFQWHYLDDEELKRVDEWLSQLS